MPDPRIDGDRFGVTGDVLDRATTILSLHLEVEKDREYGGWICSECGFSFGELPIEADERQAHAVEACAPVIAEAGYRAGIEAARAAVEDCAVDYEGTPITEVHRDDLRDAFAALTDTEGRDE